jgi:hypothetical protein
LGPTPHSGLRNITSTKDQMRTGPSHSQVRDFSKQSYPLSQYSLIDRSHPRQLMTSSSLKRNTSNDEIIIPRRDPTTCQESGSGFRDWRHSD